MSIAEYSQMRRRMIQGVDFTEPESAAVDLTPDTRYLTPSDEEPVGWDEIGRRPVESLPVVSNCVSCIRGYGGHNHVVGTEVGDPQMEICP